MFRSSILLLIFIVLLLPKFTQAAKFKARLGGYGPVTTGKHRFSAHKLEYFMHLEISHFCKDLPPQDAYNPKPPKVMVYIQPINILSKQIILKSRKKKHKVELSAKWQKYYVGKELRYDKVTARSNFGPPHGIAPAPAYVVLEYKHNGKNRKLTVGKWSSQKPPKGTKIFYNPEYIFYKSDLRVSFGWDMFNRTKKGFIGMPPGIPAFHFWPPYCKAYSIRVLKDRRPAGKFYWMKPWAKPSDPRQGYKIKLPGGTQGEWTFRYKIVAPRGFYPGDLPKLAKYGFYKMKDPKKKNRADNHVLYKGKMKDGYPLLKKVLRYK